MGVPADGFRVGRMPLSCPMPEIKKGRLPEEPESRPEAEEEGEAVRGSTRTSEHGCP